MLGEEYGQADNDQDEGNESNDNENYEYDNSSLANEGSVYLAPLNESADSAPAPNGANGSSSNPKPPATSFNNSNIREVHHSILIANGS